MAKILPKKSAETAKAKTAAAKTKPTKVAHAKTSSIKTAPAKTAPAKIVPAKKLSQYFYANGRRKTAIAMVRMHKDGKGTVTVNDRPLENYFPVLTDQDKIFSPLRMTNTAKMFDINVRVLGSGIHAQAEAVRHGISKALLQYDGGLRTMLKRVGFLTRDSRVKERKKYGLHRARRAPQWQKR